MNYDVVVIGAGFSGLYMLHKLRDGSVGGRVGGRRGHRRHVALQPVSGARCDIEASNALQLLLRRDPAGMGMDRDDAGPAGDRAYLRRRRQARPAPGHPPPTPGWTRWRSPTMQRTPPNGRSTPTPARVFTARFVVAASGILSVPLEPDIPAWTASGCGALHEQLAQGRL